jgi:hypothetical protein
MFIVHPKKVVLILTEEFAVDLESCLHWGKLTLFCLWPVTEIFRLKIHWGDVQWCFVRVR